MTFDLLQLGDLSDAEEIFEHGKRIFANEYLNQSGARGEIVAHDGSKVVFYPDRYDHAFCTSYDRARRPYDKSKVAIDRIERMLWIKELICKTRSKVICKEQTPPPRWKRAYYCHESHYVVWLEPLKLQDGRPIDWKFSSAYPQPVTDYKRTTFGFKTVL